jgi:hypothetical protein
MKQRTLTIVLVAGLLLFLLVWSFGSSAASNNSKPESDSVEANQSTEPAQGDEDQDVDADLGKWGSRRGIDRDEYLRLRDEYNARKRGIEPGRPFDPGMRGRAIEQMERQEKNRKIESLVNGSLTPLIGAAASVWTPIGPTTISNGQPLSGGNTSVSGRVTAIVVDPTNANTVYLGTAQGGVWRSLDGGTSWAAITDSAQSLAIGALALAPSDPTILYVGTGEFNGCGDCFFGAGLYRIDNANTSPSLVGPINPSLTLGGLTYNVFNGRGITKIVVDPTNAATIFVATGRGIGGSGGNQFGLVPNLATRGLWRSTNATSAAGSVTFQKLVVNTDNSPDSPATGNIDTTDIVMEPGVPNNLLVAVIGTSLNGGIFRTTNALAGTPTFTQVFSAATGVRTNLAINKVGSVVTAYAATSESAPAGASCPSSQLGAVRKQIDPFNDMTTWSTKLAGGGGFCGGQCFYDITIAVNPTDANEVYLGGNARGTCSDGMKKSINGGTSFTRDDNGIHADSHALFYDAAGTTIFTGNDGGVWKRSASASAATPWTNLNNAPLNTLQFESIAVHPTDRNLMIGGTQDNGTEYQQGTVGNWSNAEGGDGGYCLIDQSATNTTNVNMYHTFFNQTGTQIGFDRAVDTTCLPNKNFWPTRGVGFLSGGDPQQMSLSCDGTADYLHNGLSLTDNVLFYAPMALGPGSPNTVYFGTDRLYRSTDRGDTMTVVSQASISSPGSGGSPISTIAIWPGDDNVRMVGLQNGQVWATSTGSSTLVNLTSASFPTNPTGSVTNKFVGRAVIDPNNSNVAYVAFSFFATAGQGIWKITNLIAAAGAAPVAPVWTGVGNGIPSIPINGLVIDPLDSNTIYAGTDIGVYVSTDGGANWSPFGTGLPRSAVFDLQIQRSNRILRAATHGRGVWEIQLNTTFKSKKTGVFRPSTGELFLKNSNSSGFADTLIVFGNPGDYPVAGDWNGDGIDSVGIYRDGVFYLRNTNSTGFADIVVPFGNAGDQPVVGDWNGDGIDTIGVYRNGTFLLRNSNTAGPPDLVFTLGNPGDIGIAGDWDGDGITTCGVFRPSNGVIFLKNSNTTGFADLSFVYGIAGDQPVAGDWNGDGIDTVGIYRNGQFFLTNSNTTGFADTVFALGNNGDFPIAGNWNGSP